MVKSIGSQQVEGLSIEEANRQLDSSERGLSAAEAQQRLAQFGRNALEEKKVSPLFPGSVHSCKRLNLPTLQNFLARTRSGSVSCCLLSAQWA